MKKKPWKNRLSQPFIIETLQSLIHPVYATALIHPESVVWKLKCETCGKTHLIHTDTDEVDPCCESQKF